MGSSAEPRVIGRYTVYREIASGGMASVWLARQRGDGGFSRVVAVKRLFPQFARDPEFVTMFRDEARLVARIRHPNVIPTLDVAEVDGELMLVMEYVSGESLSKLCATARERSEVIEPAVAVAVITGVLEGLHSAHEATNERGVPLQMVHRDVSPQNVIVGADGVARVFDFGVAKAVDRLQQTTEAGQIKGKVVYMPPEQVFGEPVDRRGDLWAASVVLWEMLAGRRLFGEIADAIRFHGGTDDVDLPSDSADAASLGPVLRRGLARSPHERFATAREMIVALERAVRPAPARRVGQWVQKLARETLRQRAAYVEELEADAARASRAAQRATTPLTSTDDAASSVEVRGGTPEQTSTTVPGRANATAEGSGTSRRALSVGVPITIVAAAVLIGGVISRNGARTQADDTAPRRQEIGASASSVATTSPLAMPSSPPSLTEAPSAEVAAPSASPSSSMRPNVKRGPSTAPRTTTHGTLLAPPSSRSSSNPLDPESRK